MIDPLTEEIIGLRDAARMFPKGSNGKYPHVGAVYRAIRLGFRGCKLESIRTPKLATSRQAVARFFRHLSEVDRPRGPLPRSGATVERRNRAVDRELDRAGI